MLAGHGNNGRDGFEGVRRDNVIGTYLHGPLLPKNIWLADRLIELALDIELEPLEDDSMRTQPTPRRAARQACSTTRCPRRGGCAGRPAAEHVRASP